MPEPGVGGNATTSEFGDLTGLTRQEVDVLLRGLGADVKASLNYVEYKFPDKSSITIRLSDGRVARVPAPRYGSDGRNINKGLRLNRDGSLVQTRDQFGNQTLGTHNTGEVVN